MHLQVAGISDSKLTYHKMVIAISCIWSFLCDNIYYSFLAWEEVGK